MPVETLILSKRLWIRRVLKRNSVSCLLHHKFMVTYQDILKNGWPRIGHHLFMAFSTRTLKLKLLRVDAEFQCAAPLCKGKGTKPRMVRRYKSDRNSTSNMHKHAKNCWGEENVSKALGVKGELSINDVHKSLTQAKFHDGSITASFERKGKGSVTFSTRQHTYMESR